MILLLFQESGADLCLLYSSYLVTTILGVAGANNLVKERVSIPWPAALSCERS